MSYVLTGNWNWIKWVHLWCVFMWLHATDECNCLSHYHANVCIYNNIITEQSSSSARIYFNGCTCAHHRAVRTFHVNYWWWRENVLNSAFQRTAKYAKGELQCADGLRFIFIRIDGTFIAFWELLLLNVITCLTGPHIADGSFYGLLTPSLTESLIMLQCVSFVSERILLEAEPPHACMFQP